VYLRIYFKGEHFLYLPLVDIHSLAIILFYQTINISSCSVDIIHVPVK